jgi:hypothetical protein
MDEKIFLESTKGVDLNISFNVGVKNERYYSATNYSCYSGSF